MGHKNIQSTLRYAHLSPKVTEENGEAVAASIYGELVQIVQLCPFPKTPKTL